MKNTIRNIKNISASTVDIGTISIPANATVNIFWSKVVFKDNLETLNVNLLQGNVELYNYKDVLLDVPTSYRILNYIVNIFLQDLDTLEYYEIIGSDLSRRIKRLIKSKAISKNKKKKLYKAFFDVFTYLREGLPLEAIDEINDINLAPIDITQPEIDLIIEDINSYLIAD